MKSDSMPTRNNNTPVESYDEYQKKIVRKVTNLVGDGLTMLYNSSLTNEDKKTLLLAINQQVAEISKDIK